MAVTRWILFSPHTSVDFVRQSTRHTIDYAIDAGPRYRDNDQGCNPCGHNCKPRTCTRMCRLGFLSLFMSSGPEGVLLLLDHHGRSGTPEPVCLCGIHGIVRHQHSQHVHGHAFGPPALQIVEEPALRRHDVHHDVSIVQEDPTALGRALRHSRESPTSVVGLRDGVCDGGGNGLVLRTAGSTHEHHVRRYRSDAVDPHRHDVFRLPHVGRPHDGLNELHELPVVVPRRRISHHGLLWHLLLHKFHEGRDRPPRPGLAGGVAAVPRDGLGSLPRLLLFANSGRSVVRREGATVAVRIRRKTEGGAGGTGPHGTGGGPAREGGVRDDETDNGQRCCGRQQTDGPGHQYGSHPVEHSNGGVPLYFFRWLMQQAIVGGRRFSQERLIGFPLI
mmetsp:Transcript_42140/g.82657  ORF Transcript_42140/g.82657 Transcript_42140/m.82657 type:complete len:389 (+) Transcript_42140:74-1240(+)